MYFVIATMLCLGVTCSLPAIDSPDKFGRDRQNAMDWSDFDMGLAAFLPAAWDTLEAIADSPFGSTETTSPAASPVTSV